LISAAQSSVSASKETCPLCGLPFDPKGQGCRPGCPLSSGCRMVCCPRCFYSFPQETRFAGALRRLLERRKQEGS